MCCLEFVAIFHSVIGPRECSAVAVRRGSSQSGRALADLASLGVVLWLAAGCRAAVTQPNNPQGLEPGAPQVITDPAQDTTVDSLGTLAIVITVRDPASIDSVAVILQGASQQYPTSYPNDTLYQATITVALAPLKHRTFSFAVNAANILGEDTTTSSVNVRVR